VQLCPAAQAVPQVPQLAVLVKSTQAPLHSVSGAVHAVIGV